MENTSAQRQLTSIQIMIQIMDDIEKIKLGRFNKEFPVGKKKCTKAISISIEETCKRLGLKLQREVEHQFSESLKKKYKRKYGIVDFVIINPNGSKIAIELDSRNKRLSYAKLEELSERNYDSFWLLYRINNTGVPYQSSYKDDYNDYYTKRKYTNENVQIIKHIFHPAPFKLLC